MGRTLIFEVEVEDDQDVPAIGTFFDVVNEEWSWLDVELTDVIDSSAAGVGGQSA